MSYGKLLLSVVGLTLVISFVVGCGTPAATSVSPTATPTPKPLTATSTPVPPTATPTPVPPTPTLTRTPFGTIDGHIVGRDTRKPLDRAQIILCLLSEVMEGSVLCTLQAIPTALSGTNGEFHFSEVPIGTYVLMYGLSDELQLTPKQWGGIEVTKAETCTDGMTNVVCRSSEDESAFWQTGGTYLGEENTLGFTKSFDEDANTMIAIAHRFTDGEGLYLLQGAVRSNFTGISIMVLEGKLAPMVQVIDGETASIEWLVNGR